MLKRTIIAVLGILLIGLPCAFADIIDLTDTTNPAIYTGITSTADGSIWRVVVDQPTGTGVYEPFLRYQKVGVETGLNTDLKPVPFDDKMPATIYTRSVLFADLGEVTIDSTDYWSFAIDFNEPTDKKWLSFDNFDIYEGSYPTAGAGDSLADLTLLWDSEATVLTDYTLASSGSGKDDIEFLIPVVANSEPYMYLYITSGAYSPSAGEVGYGRAWTAQDGFEEIRTTGIPHVPEPATMLLLGTGLLGLAVFRRKRLFKK